MTKTEILRRGILASGWTKCETRSGRECYTKHVAIVDRVTRQPRGEQQMWMWLSEVATIRWHNRNAYSDSRSISPRHLAMLLAAGEKAAADGANLLKGLES